MKLECRYCEEEIENPEEMIFYGDPGTDYENEPLCEVCYYEATPCGSVVYSDGSGPLGEKCPHLITPTRNETEGEFLARWVSTDPWRGYYEFESEVYEKVHNDCILSGSRDAENLKRFDDLLRELMDQEGIAYARAFPRTSNVFSCGYELWIHKGDLPRYRELVEAIKEAAEKQLRDPWAFQLTALTGKDPEDADEKDRLFAFLGSFILASGK